MEVWKTQVCLAAVVQMAAFLLQMAALLLAQVIVQRGPQPHHLRSLTQLICLHSSKNC